MAQQSKPLLETFASAPATGTSPSSRASSVPSGSNAPPVIALPKGGGAIHGIGEKFAANPVTGTGSLSVPIAVTPGRGGFGPQLSLSYDSGAGNGPFGFGWNLSLPAITRKTDKGLPRYFDAEAPDEFILSGAEDLVPVLTQDDEGNWVPEAVPPRTVGGKTYRIQRYRPRIEGLFARIERWTDQTDSSDSFWRSIGKDNVTTWYGKTDDSRIADPNDSSRIFNWLVCQSHDDKGNVIVYEYAEENSAGVDTSQVHERNRTSTGRSVNRYIKRIKYGNNISRLAQPADFEAAGWHFQVVFDYEQGHYRSASADGEDPFYIEAWADPVEPADWPVRQDPFSGYRAGFEVRAYRLCRRVLMFHDFESLGDSPCLVRSTDFAYEEGSIASFMTAVTHSGYVRQRDEHGTFNDKYLKKSLPPVEFSYSKAPTAAELALLPVQNIDAASLENLPVGLDEGQYQWIDLDGEGIPGILSRRQGAWHYKDNRGAGSFGPMIRVAEIPSLAAAGSNHQLLDLAGDGQLDVALFESPTPGFYERTLDASWEPFRSFTSMPNLAWNDPNLKFVDLTGDGHADLIITEDDAFVWHASLAEEGFAAAERVAKSFDEEKGPYLVFADATQSIYLADMSGDGLTDIVRIRNGAVCYWPNLGYARFGAKVAMDNAPWFDAPDIFSQQRIRLADTDGSGVTDIIYLRHDGARVYFNQSGNRWSDAATVPQFPRVDDLSSVQVLDLLGKGTACLTWSSPLPADTSRRMRYVDLMGGEKPHLLVKTVNNLGAETHVSYVSSTAFYLADKAGGKPWITSLPFPVHVVERVEIYDCISRNLFVTRYAYHHGYFDGAEREFRGFGMVEQWDTEEFAALGASSAFPPGDNVEESSHVPPVLTKTWFHTGVYLGRDRISKYFAGLLDADDIGEYYREPGLTDEETKQLLIEDTMLPAELDAEEEREACRALKGAMLRQEIYALDGTDKEPHPYIVTEQNFDIRCLQPKADNRHGVFLAHPREAISYHYERNPNDPRVGHAMTLEVDDYGNVLKSAAIGYERRNPDPDLASEDQDKQTQTPITYTENRFTNAITEDDAYRAPLPCESRTYEMTGLRDASDSDRFTFDELLGECAAAALLDYEEAPVSGQTQKRLIEHVRTLYRKDDLTDLQALGTLESLALPGESYRLAFTPGLAKQIYVDSGKLLQVDLDAVLADDGRYMHSEGDANWWIPSGRIFYSPGATDDDATERDYSGQHFYLPNRYRDPFHTDTINTETVVSYDDYDLLVRGTRDALGNTVNAQHDYRVLQPTLVTDANGNRAAAAFDALGLVAGTAIMGKTTETLGDSLDGFEADLTQAETDRFLSNPKGPGAATSLGKASTRIVYDVGRYRRTQDPDQPPFSATVLRETHASDPVPDGGLKVQVSFSYSDGFGREIQKKVQAEPGPVPERDEDGEIVLDASNQPVLTDTDVDPRWVGSGWTVFNNKGKPVRQYEPFFTDRHDFEFDVRIGVSPVLFYDPVARVVATLHPDRTWDKVVFDPWRQETWDGSDTLLVADPGAGVDVGEFFRRLPDTAYLPGWYAQRESGALGAQEQNAARKAAVHAETPTVTHADSLGRAFLTVAHNKFRYSDAASSDPTNEDFHSTRILLDIEGNQREVVDAKDRVVMRYDYDMLGNRIHQASMEAGERWMLLDVAGKSIYGWNSRDHRFRTAYDPLQRPTEAYLREGVGTELLVGRTVYGEGQPDPEANNLRGKVVQLYDQAGVVTSDDYDFKGNLLRSQRQLAVEYKTTLDWSVDVALEASTYTRRTLYDALNRPTELTAPDASVIRPTYNEANLLERIEANLRGAAEATPFVNDIDYDAKGRRTLIEYGNGAKTEYEYDPLTFRLIHLLTRRDVTTFPDDCPDTPTSGWPGCQVQNLSYTYDPVGNITHIRDDAQQTVYFRNQRVEPSAEYTYDAIYRLIEATGREHLGQAGGSPIPHSYNDAARVGLLHPGDGNAMGSHAERYVYDAVGNFLEMQHRGSDPAHAGWTRSYTYSEASLIDSAKQSNRLSSTTVGSDAAEIYSYDAHGNMLRMPQLQAMQWDFRDQLQMTQRQAVGSSDTDGAKCQGERTYYVYDAGGQRVRKVTELATGALKDERIYLGGFEIYRRHSGVDAGLVRETLHIMDDKQRIALVETRNDVDDGTAKQLIRFQFGNHLGSACLDLDDQAQIISYEEYTPYGSTSYQAARSQTETPRRYRYTGKERDEESGLYYHGARYYAPWVARWCSVDPKPDQLSYAYGGNNPVVFYDPDGKVIQVGLVLGGAAVGASVGAAVGIWREWSNPKGIDWGTVAAHSAGGAVSGGIAGATGGLSLVAEGSLTSGGIFLAGEAGASAAGGTVTRSLLGKETTREDLAWDAFIGAATAGTLKGGGAIISKLRNGGDASTLVQETIEDVAEQSDTAYQQVLKEQPVAVELGAGDAGHSVDLALQGYRVIATDPVKSIAPGDEELLKFFGGEFRKMTATEAAEALPDQADLVVWDFMFPLTTRAGGEGGGNLITRGTFSAVEDALTIAKPGGTVRFVTEDLSRGPINTSTIDSFASEAKRLQATDIAIGTGPASEVAPGSSMSGIADATGDYIVQWIEFVKKL
ncbi:MAG: toxin [Betaproteobacteria bacterium]|nr:toxin [Betaproteobacteria bacterium]